MSIKQQIEVFNGMYGLPVEPKPTIGVTVQGQLPTERLSNFQDILSKETDELGDEVRPLFQVLAGLRGTDCLDTDAGRKAAKAEEGGAELDALTSLADLLADVCVYCRSEAAKFGIPLDDVLQIVMESNMSKLGEDGKPILDERGKVQKGPNYWKPEPRIRELLQAHRDLTDEDRWNYQRQVLEHELDSAARGLVVRMGCDGLRFVVPEALVQSSNGDVKDMRIDITLVPTEAEPASVVQPGDSSVLAEGMAILDRAHAESTAPATRRDDNLPLGVAPAGACDCDGHSTGGGGLVLNDFLKGVDSEGGATD